MRRWTPACEEDRKGGRGEKSDGGEKVRGYMCCGVLLLLSYLVVILERLEKVVPRLLELPLRHVHLAAALPYHAHDLGVGYGRLDLQSLRVERFELLVVLCVCREGSRSKGQARTGH